MKQLRVISSIFLLCIIALASMAFTIQNDGTGIVNALKSGKADAVAGYFDNILDIKFPDKDEAKNIGKNQAGIALRSFYNDNNITGFELSSQREMGGTMYIAGKLINDGDGFKISIMMKAKEGRQQIITVRINQ